MAAETARRIAQRQALLCEVNERIHEIAGDFSVTEEFSILCECASSECRELIALTQTEYEYLRWMPTASLYSTVTTFPRFSASFKKTTAS